MPVLPAARTCRVCHRTISPDIMDELFICDLCRLHNPDSVAAELKDMHDRAVAYLEKPELYYAERISKNGFRTTTDGSECWVWVIVRNDDYEPVHVPESQTFTSRLRWLSGPYNYGSALLVRKCLDELFDLPHEIYDYTGFLLTPNNNLKFWLSLDDAIWLIHEGQIKYVFHSIMAWRREYHFPPDQSLVTSFLGDEPGYTLIRRLEDANHIHWKEGLQVYVTRWYDPLEDQVRPNFKETDIHRRLRLGTERD